jgi:hypothetical protein
LLPLSTFTLLGLFVASCCASWRSGRAILLPRSPLSRSSWFSWLFLLASLIASLGEVFVGALGSLYAVASLHVRLGFHGFSPFPVFCFRLRS